MRACPRRSWLSRKNASAPAIATRCQRSQIRPMTRVQIARDLAMADTVAAVRQPGRVLLVAGTGHVARGLGVPVHLAVVSQDVDPVEAESGGGRFVRNSGMRPAEVVVLHPGLQFSSSHV